MAIETVEDIDPAIRDDSSIMVVRAEPTREEEIRNAAEIIIREDEIFIDGEEEEGSEQIEAGFNDNLAEYLDSASLLSLSINILSSIDGDKASRSEWEDTYTDGLKYLGMKFEESRSVPFQGASGVIHPILAEAVTQFQAQAYKELLPAKGPVKTEVVGAKTPEVEEQAQRVEEFMNWYILNVMREYDPELDMLLFYLPLAGSAFKKVYFETSENKAKSKFIAPEDLIVPYEATDIESAERITHVLRMSKNEIKKQQLSGFYSDVDLSNGGANISGDEISEQIDSIEGLKPSYTEDRENLVYEVHTILDIEGFEDLDEEGEPTGLKLPYIVTIDESSRKILSIKRNYYEQDPSKSKINYFVQYKFLPGLGFYGLGLSHMIGGLAKASTSILRQLIDAGTLSNLPAGFKARGMRIRDEDSPIQPGEFRDIDTTGASLKDNLIPLPIKEPSNVLMSLLGLLVDAGKRFASIGDMNLGDMNQAMPVGTTVALLERGTKVMSAIHKRLHYAQRMEFELLAKVFGEFLPPEYPYQSGSGEQNIKAQDFSNTVSIIPVSDPNIFSQSQRITMAQELLQMVQSNPEIHGPSGTYEAYRRMYAALGVDDVNSLLTPPPEPPPPPPPMQAGDENGGLLMGQPQQAFADQDHRSHIETHRLLLVLEVVKQNPPIQANIIAHIMQHLQFMAQKMAEQQIPPEMQEKIQQIQSMQEQMPPEEFESAMQGIQTEKDNIAAPILAELSQSLMSSLETGDKPDPLVQIRQQELSLREQEMNNDSDQFSEKQQQRDKEKNQEDDLARERINIQKEVADDKLRVAMDRLQQQADLKMLELNQKLGGQ